MDKKVIEANYDHPAVSQKDAFWKKYDEYETACKENTRKLIELLKQYTTLNFQVCLIEQRGILIGGGYKWFGLSGYLYNLGFDDPYLILSLAMTIPEN